jgi:hypothetical protein
LGALVGVVLYAASRRFAALDAYCDRAKIPWLFGGAAGSR